MYEAGKSDQTEGGEAFAGHSAHSRHSPYYAWYVYYDIVVPWLAAAARVVLGAAAPHRHCYARPPRFALSLAFAVR